MLIASLAIAQVQPEEILFLPWNSDSLGNVTYTHDPEGRVGPQNFQISGDTVSLLNQQCGAINVYAGQRLVEQLPVTPLAKDFLINSSDDYVCLADNQLIFYRQRQAVSRIRQSGRLPLIRKLIRVNEEIMAINHDGTVSKIDRRRLTKSALPGIVTYELLKESRSQATVTIRDAAGRQSGTIRLSFEGHDLGSFNLIGSDKYGRIYLDCDFIVQDTPLKVRREVRILDAAGMPFGKIILPNHYYAMMWNDLRLDKEGRLYHLLSSEDGLHFLYWDFTIWTKDYFEGVYPEKYQRYLHYNDAVWEVPETPEKKSPLAKTTATVTRSQALATAETYAVHEWTCTTANLTSSAGVVAPDGLIIITPSWIESGENIRIPYKWGGFSTLAQFDAGLLSGKYAGDRCTSKSSGSSYAVGVDCSGFVSRCWNLSSHYSTSMMDDNITVAYDSWDSLKAGDAIHKVGHVRLAVENLANGSILAVEAAGSSTDWRVNYRTYTYSNLSDYTPRYYINMIGPNIAMEQPVLKSARHLGDHLNVKWSLISTEYVDGIQIQYSEDGISWEKLLGDSLLAPEATACSLDWSGNLTYLRLKSINNSGSVIAESLPSDTYGFFTNSGCSGKILIVDGFDRASGSWGLPYHAFVQWMGENLSALGISFETAANEAISNGEIVLSEYPAVYWILGDESTADETFSTVEQALVADYLETGGRLFVSGSEIGWDLGSLGEAADQAFYLNYLHADYVKDDSDDYTVSGTSGGIFNGLTLEYDDGSAGIYDEDYPDVIKPMLSAVVCLEYSSGVVAGIQYEGLFGSGSEPGKLVYLAFPWETITTPDDRKAVLEKVSQWFGFDCSGMDHDKPPIPATASLSPGFPNPFNNRVTFRLTLPERSDYKVFIYNSLGQIVRHLEIPKTGGSEYCLTWDGCNDWGSAVASGCYFFRVAADDRILTQKVVLLK
jgi:hypothetical protein